MTVGSDSSAAPDVADQRGHSFLNFVGYCDPRSSASSARSLASPLQSSKVSFAESNW